MCSHFHICALIMYDPWIQLMLFYFLEGKYQDTASSLTQIMCFWSFRILYVQIVSNGHPLIIAKLSSFQSKRKSSAFWFWFMWSKGFSYICFDTKKKFIKKGTTRCWPFTYTHTCCACYICKSILCIPLTWTPNREASSLVNALSCSFFCKHNISQ